MSRTRNTRPLRARPECWEPWHNHRHGECDLIPLEEYLSLPRRHQYRTRCCWSLEWGHLRDTRCSCEGCRDHIGRRRKQKKLRQATKLLLKQADTD